MGITCLCLTWRMAKTETTDRSVGFAGREKKTLVIVRWKGSCWKVILFDTEGTAVASDVKCLHECFTGFHN